MAGLFTVLPDNFFSPLAFSMKEHYAELLKIYYRLFVEYSTGVEKEQLISAYEEYFETLPAESIASDEIDVVDTMYEKTPRGLASRSMRRLIQCGWMSEETLIDFTTVINITSHARPFYEAISYLTEGASVEYESHIVNIYSSLCNVAVRENGHLSVMNAHVETRRLIDSLKVLSQNIKNYIQELYDHSGEVRDILHIHYDLYMGQIVDKAYNRMKTSDNLSRYRPQIIKSINSLLDDESWMTKFGRKYAEIKNRQDEWGRREIAVMLNEIKDDLKSLDPIIEEIDDKNRRYSGISTEKIKTGLYGDDSLESRISGIVNALSSGKITPGDVCHGVFTVKYLDLKSLYVRRRKQAAEYIVRKLETDPFEIEKGEAELRLRILKHLNPEKISAFLNSRCSGQTIAAADLARDMDSFVRMIYAALYAESRSFPYGVRWGEGYVEVGRFKFKEHWFVKNEKEHKRDR